jgi:ribonuclease D
MSIVLHRHDLPPGVDFGRVVAVDTETMGLNLARDRLCLVQLSAGDGSSHLVQFDRPPRDAPNLTRLLTDPGILKLFHFARFDLAALKQHLGVDCAPVYCTKIASKLARTYTDRHGLKDLASELLGLELGKEMQSSDWGRSELTEAQRLYAAHDVLHLHAIRQRLDEILEREGRMSLAEACFAFLHHRVELDLRGGGGVDVFAHR